MISTKLLKRYAEKISTPEPSSVWVPYFRCMIVSFASLHVENQSLLGSEREGRREKYQGHVSLMLGTISGVVIMVLIILCYERHWIKYINNPESKTKWFICFQMSTQITCASRFVLLLPKNQQKIHHSNPNRECSTQQSLLLKH